MLAYLDTAIGFVVVMLVISLLIDSDPDGFVADQSQGSNLLWGLKTIFANINPTRIPVERPGENVARKC